MKLNFRIIAKLALLLVVIGFFMPIACNRNGFEIANYAMNHDKVLEGLLAYLSLASAIAGLFVGVLRLLKNRLNPNTDWIVIVVCIASGLVPYCIQLNNKVLKVDFSDLQTGGYLILAGWIIALVFQVFSTLKREK